MTALDLTDREPNLFQSITMKAGLPRNVECGILQGVERIQGRTQRVSGCSRGIAPNFVWPNWRRPGRSEEYLSPGSGNRHARLFRLDLLNHAHPLRRVA